jgi:hypothetical protein
MPIRIEASLDYSYPEPTDVLLRIEAAMIPEQAVKDPQLSLSEYVHFARVPGQYMIG